LLIDQACTEQTAMSKMLNTNDQSTRNDKAISDQKDFYLYQESASRVHPCCYRSSNGLHCFLNSFNLNSQAILLSQVTKATHLGSLAQFGRT
jgi:hypothetical protein